MICRNCGREIPDDSRFCSYCSANLTNIAPNNAQGYAQPGYNQQYYSQQPVQNGYQQPYGAPPVQNVYFVPVQPQKPAGIPGTGQCTTALVLSIIALVLCWIPFVSFISILLAFIGFINGIIGVIRSSAAGKVRAQGIVGLILSIISFIPTVLFIMVFIEEGIF